MSEDSHPCIGDERVCRCCDKRFTPSRTESQSVCLDCWLGRTVEDWNDCHPKGDLVYDCHPPPEKHP